MTEARRALVDAVHRHTLGGAAVAVVHVGAPAELECAGIADQATERTITPQTVFRIASISKTMTAIGVLQLRDAGRLDLDDAVNKHLTSFRIEPPAGGRDVTFRDLLTHTSGIGEAPRRSDLARREAWGMGKPGTAPADLAALYGGVLRPDTAAGTKWAYANHGFAVLGQVVEDLAGQPFGAYMRERVFGPLGMEHTEYTRTDRTADEVATGYHWMFGRFRSLKDYDLALLGPGSVLSSLSDMAIYAEWLLHGGAGVHGAGEVLRPETLAEMMSPQYSVDPRLPGMGLAFWLDHLGEQRVVGHDGNVPGFGSSLLLAPDDGVAVVALTNTSSAIGAHLLATDLLSSLLSVDSPSTRLHNLDVVSRPHLWTDLEGHYAPAPGFLTNARAWQMVGGEVQVLVKNRRLLVRALSPLPALRRGLELHAVDGDDPLAFAVEMDGLVVPIVFARDAFGPVDRVIVGPPANTTFHRRSNMRSSRVRGRAVLASTGVAAAALGWRRRRRRKGMQHR